MSVIITVALAAASCTGGGDDEGAEDTSNTTTTTTPETATPETATPETTTTVVEIEPELVIDDSVCDDVPLEATCGFVAVPVDHDDPAGDTLRVAVAVLGSTAAAPTDDPVVYLDGGPGGNAIDTIAFRAVDFYEPLLARGDVVVVDQRGVGRSEPALDCPELFTVLDRVLADPERTDADEDAALLDSIEACGDRLASEGIDVNAYNSVANADDIDLVRRALGIDEWNLVGISYGTRLGLEVLRRHPEGVRAAVLDSVLPPEAELIAGSVEGFRASFERVEAACATDPDCSPTAPLGERLEALIAALDAAPVLVVVADPLTLTEVEVVADGDVLLGVVGGALYDPLLFGDLPELFDDLEAGGTDALEIYLTLDLVNRNFTTIGMFQAVSCSDDTNGTDPAVLDTLDPDDLWARALDGLNIGPLALDACARFGATGVTAQADEPVESEVPALVLAGSFDPITPPSYSVDAAEGLSQSVVIEHGSLGHATLSDVCVLGVALAFLDDPTVAPDTSCVDEAAPIDFTPEGLGELVLAPVTAEVPVFGAEITAIVPVSWAAQAGSVGDRVRSQGVLDPTSISVFASQEPIVELTVDFLAAGLEAEFDELAPLEISGDTWRRRGAVSGSVAVDVFERGPDDNDLISVYVFASELDERDALIEQIVRPGLASMEAVPLS